MVARNKKTISPKIWIPPNHYATYKITITRSDGTIDDITDSITSCIVEDLTTEGIGTFEVELPNYDNQYTDAWTGMEIFKYYKDYADTATTIRFYGRIEKPSKRGSKILIKGRSESLFMVEKTITKSYSNADTAVILDDLFDDYGESRYVLTSIPALSGTTLTINWVDKPFWEAVIELCKATGYECYIDADLTVQFFATGSIDNTTEGLNHDTNIIDIGDFAPDIQLTKNQIRVYGAVVDNSQVIYTANNTAAQTSNGVRRRNVVDDSIITFTQARELGDALLSTAKDPPTVGEVTGVLLATIKPGDRIKISAPLDGLDYGYYTCVGYKDEVGEDKYYTTVSINKQQEKISHLIKNRIGASYLQQTTTSNPNDLDFALAQTFGSDVGTHSNTEITGGVLKKLTAGSAGTWTSPTTPTPDGNNVSQVRLRVDGTNKPGATYKISLNGGTTYETVTLKALTTLTTTAGDKIVVKIELTDDDVQFNSYTIQFNTA